MKKDNPEKRPRGRQPAGAVLVDGKWQLTERSVQLAAERMLWGREIRRNRIQAMRKLLRLSHPELFVVRGLDPRQTTLTPEVRSKRSETPISCLVKSQTPAATPPATPSPPACFGVHNSATMALQVFRADQHLFEVTTVTVDRVVWFKGREVAACLEYSKNIPLKQGSFLAS